MARDQERSAQVGVVHVNAILVGQHFHLPDVCALARVDPSLIWWGRSLSLTLQHLSYTLRKIRTVHRYNPNPYILLAVRVRGPPGLASLVYGLRSRQTQRSMLQSSADAHADSNALPMTQQLNTQVRDNILQKSGHTASYPRIFANSGPELAGTSSQQHL